MYAVAADITRHNPSCFLFVLDQSSSMAQPFGNRTEETQTKAEGVALAINSLLRNLIISCSKSDGVRNYFDVGVIGYGQTVGPAWSGPLAGQELVPIRDVAQFYARMSENVVPVPDNAGDTTTQTVRSPVWVEPKAGGSTLMCAGLRYAHQILAQWMMRNPTAHPPVVVHITDGEGTDGDPAPLMQAITSLSGANGGAGVTLFNVHLSSSREAAPTSFPADAGGLPNAFAHLLFEQASYLSPFMRSVAWDNGLTVGDAARAFVLNADPSLMVLALEIGTRPGSAAIFNGMGRW